MGWADFQGRGYTREEFKTYVEGLQWTPRVWNPQVPQLPAGIVLHNTAAPKLSQWVESGPQYEARIKNLRRYYEVEQKWHGGPHLFISRTTITIFDGLLERGTHSPSFNASHFGIEMVGDYSTEPFNTGDGAKVRDNAVFAMACLCKKFGWDPAKVIKLHKEDPRTSHDCPGKNVVKSDVVRRVSEMIVQLGAPRPSEPTRPEPIEPLTPVSPPVSPPVSDALRRRMVRMIYESEARRDGQGRLQIYELPPEDRGGKYEVAGINDRYHPEEAKALADLIRAGKHEEAERRVQDFYLEYTAPAMEWTSHPGIEYFLRSTIFNRGPGGGAITLQHALGVAEDGDVGPLTKAALAKADPVQLIGKLCAAREWYEREHMHRDESSSVWRGLKNRWNTERDNALLLHRESGGTLPISAGRGVLWAQRALNKLIDTSTIKKLVEDGVMGPKTETMLRAFQRDKSLPETGRLDDLTRVTIQERLDKNGIVVEMDTA